VVVARIAIVTLYNPFEIIRGGIESVVYNQSKALARLKHEVWIVTMGNVQQDTKTNVQGVNLRILPDRNINDLAKRSLLFIRDGKTIIEEIEKELEIEVFNGQGGYSSPLAFANLKESKKVLTVHTIDGENIARTKDCLRVGNYKEFVFEALKYPVLRVWRSFFFLRADALVFVSRYALNEFKNYYPYLMHKPYDLIENGFPKLNRSCSTSVKEEDYDFVYAGRIDKIKGVDLVVRAACLLKKKRFSFKIAIIGDGPWKESIEKLTKELNVTDRVHFLGHLRHGSASKVLRTARCFILPSFYESDPLVIKECMILGIPIICSDIPPLRGKMANYENGFTFRCGDCEDLSEAMESVISAREDMNTETRGAATKDLNAADFPSWEEVARNYIEFFKLIIQDRKRDISQTV